MSRATSSRHSRSANSATSNHRSRSTNRAASSRRQEEQSGPSESRLDRIERILEGVLTHVTRNEPPRHTPHMLDQYRRQRPPVFRGKAGDDPSAAEYWIEQTEKLLQHLQCSDEEKVNCATFMLEEEAARWWQSAQRALQRTPRQAAQDLRPRQAQAITWEAFKEVFNAKYFPQSWKEERTWEFMNLKQTDEMSVTQYDVKFTQLIRYVPMYETDERQKAQKFVSGLKVDLQQALSSCTINTYNEALDRALTTEMNLLRIGLIRSDEKKKDSKGTEHKTGGKNFKDSKPCPRCNKEHPGRNCSQGHITCFSCGEKGHKEKDCSKKKDVPPTGNRTGITCYSCNQPGHYASECPKRQKMDQPGKITMTPGPRTGRVFCLTRENEEVYPGLARDDEETHPTMTKDMPS
ncbi:uncharacterized protein LOC127811811 [Diospyros lotus]|uniref:uncharacterized protein LOC127811811 n=1 Tax=Diospyros lotus TaxID=55363 RepID=UPI002256A4E8|nr:uncharacterized protein LOC127811811 [Diospyros lotus]